MAPTTTRNASKKKNLVNLINEGFFMLKLTENC